MWFDYEKDTFCSVYDNNSRKYEGAIKNGLPDGQGVYYDE